MLKLILIGIFLCLILIILSFLNSKPYPKEWEDKEDDELRKKFDEYKNNNQD